MIDMEKLVTAKVWIEKLANGINPLNDELVKEVWSICTLGSNVTYREGLLYKHCESFKETVRRIK
jgi:hypothetical protein